MSCKNELVLNGITYNTSNLEHRRLIGKMMEIKLKEYFAKHINCYDIEHISNDNPFNRYDFVIKNDKDIYLVELKSRLGSIEKHSIEKICYKKIRAYKKIIKQHPTTKIMFVFCHIIDENDYKFYYYIIEDFKQLDEDTFLNMEYSDWLYELSTKTVKELEYFI